MTIGQNHVVMAAAQADIDDRVRENAFVFFALKQKASVLKPVYWYAVLLLLSSKA